MNWDKKDGVPCTILSFVKLFKFLMNCYKCKLMSINVQVTVGCPFNLLSI